MNSLEGSVYRTLKSSEAMRIKPFTFGSFTITATQFYQLAMSIKYNGTPAIKYDKNQSSTGIYNPVTNTLWFNFAKAKTTSQKGLIIHEATHAILDMYSVKTNIKYAETFAYIAQCQYLMLAEPNMSRWQGDTPESDRKWDAAWSLATKLQLGGIVESEDYERVAEGIYADPVYKNECHQIADYQGLY